MSAKSAFFAPDVRGTDILVRRPQKTVGPPFGDTGLFPA